MSKIKVKKVILIRIVTKQSFWRIITPLLINKDLHFDMQVFVLPLTFILFP